MINFGAVPAGSVLPVIFDSYAGSTGASITISGLAATDIEIYKGTSMTQRSSDAGYTLLDTDGIDIDGITGIHGFSIDLGDNTDAGFYAAGSFYTIVVSAITVDTQTVNFVAATFRIVAAENTAGYPVIDAAKWNNLATVALPLIPTTAGRTLDVSATGEAGIDWANIGSPTTAVNLSATNIDVDQVVASVSGAVGSVTGAVGSVTGNVGGNVVGTVAGVTPAIAGDAMALTSAERNSTADALLDRNVSGGSSAGRTVKQALHVLRNKTDIAAGTLTVYDTDDTTASFTAAVTTTAGDPISQIDPA